ncbi:ADP-ribosyltransferase [Enterococcus faecium]|uniref:ADP-ribosyltransferase n=1 Tax=Enterococcus faecium TaxID=1352 RepID=UPI0035196930
MNYTFTEKSIIYSYTYDQSSVINGSLEHVNGNIDLLPEHIREEVLSLDLSINRLQIPWDIITYRYVYEDFLLYSLVSKEQLDQFYKNKRFDPQILDIISYGTKVNKYGFMSTTVLKNGAMSHRPIELKIRLSRGNHGAYIAPYSAFPYEQELLLPRNSQLIVDGAHLENNNQRLVLDALYVI